MAAGQPNWQRLHEMGKLPKGQRGQIASLVQLDALEARLEEVKAGCCDNCREKLFSEKVKASVATAKCDVEGCAFVAEGKLKMNAANTLRRHMEEVHKPKEE